MADELSIIVVTLGLALPGGTWVERVVRFECDPEFENDNSFDLCATAMEHWVSQNTEEANHLAPSGWWVIFHEWSDEQAPEERPDRPCDADCARRLAGNDSVECTCSRSKLDFDSPQDVCPRCKSENIANEDDAHDGILEVHCLDCGQEWVEPFKGSTVDAPILQPELTFKVDDRVVKVGNNMKVEYEDREEGRTLIITLTHEGIIMDVWDMCENEPTATSSMTFNEKMEEMLDN